MIVLLKKLLNKIRLFNSDRRLVIWGEEVPKYSPEARFAIGGSRCELCGEVNVYDGFVQIKKHICKKSTIK